MPIIIKQTNQYIHIVMLFAHLLFQIYTHSLCILTHDMDTSHNATVEPCVTVNEMFPGIFTFPATLGSYDTRIREYQGRIWQMSVVQLIWIQLHTY